jgi:hypothetical protein
MVLRCKLKRYSLQIALRNFDRHRKKGIAVASASLVATVANGFHRAQKEMEPSGVEPETSTKLVSQGDMLRLRATNCAIAPIDVTVYKF